MFLSLHSNNRLLLRREGHTVVKPEIAERVDEGYSSYIPTQHGLAVHVSTEVPLVQVFRACRSYGSKAHLLGECPVLYYSDSNTDHQAEWEGSTVGMAWAAVGFTEWQ